MHPAAVVVGSSKRRAVSSGTWIVGLASCLALAGAPAARGAECPVTVADAAFASAEELRALVTKEMSFGQRNLASRSHNKLLRWIEDEVRGIHDDFALRSDEYAVMRWLPRTPAKGGPGLDIGRAGGLRVEPPNGRAQDVPVAGAVHWSKPTGAKGRRGGLVYLAEDEEITADNAAGKVVLRDFPGGRGTDRPFVHRMQEQLLAAGQAGAAGVIYAFDVPYEQVYGYYDPHTGTLYSVPAVFVGTAEAEQLKALAVQNATARVRVRAKVKRAKTRNLIATLPGQSGERIVLATNTDGNSWVQENGVAGLLALARYYAALPLECRPRTLVLAFGSSHDALITDGTNRYAEELEAEYDQGTVAFAFAIEHLGAREIVPVADGVGPGRRLELTGRGEPFLFAAGDSEALRQTATAAAQRRNLDATLVVSGLGAPVPGQVPPVCSMGGLGNAFHRKLIPTLAMISGPWSLYAPSFEESAIDFDRMRAQLLAAGDSVLALHGLPREQIAGDYPAMRTLRAQGAPTCPPETYPQFGPGPGGSPPPP